MYIHTRKILKYYFQNIAFSFYIVLIAVSCSSTSPNKVDEQSNEGDGYVRQGVQYMYAGRLDEALISIKSALDINPDSADAYTVAGLIYNKNNQPDLAEKFFKRALSSDPNNSAAQTNYASFLCKHDKPLEAEKLYLAAAKNKNNTQPDVAYTNAGLCVLGIPDTLKAADYFQKAIKINPKSPVAVYQLSKIQYANYEYEIALQHLKQYEAMAQPTPKTLLLGVQISEAMQNQQMADQYKLALTQRFPNSAEAQQLNKSSTSTNISVQPAVFDARTLLEEN